MNKLVIPVLALPRFLKRLVVLVLDCSLCILTVWFAYYLRLGEFVALSDSAFWASLAAILIALPIFVNTLTNFLLNNEYTNSIMLIVQDDSFLNYFDENQNYNFE